MVFFFEYERKANAVDAIKTIGEFVGFGRLPLKKEDQTQVVRYFRLTCHVFLC